MSSSFGAERSRHLARNGPRVQLFPARACPISTPGLRAASSGCARRFDSCGQAVVEWPAMKFAIVGAPSSGKTTLFNLLTGAKGPAGGYSGPGLKLGVAFLPDRRLDVLAELVGAKKRTHASMECADVTGLVRKEGAGLSTSASILARVREFEALVVVVRGKAPAVEARELETEFALSDLEMVERRIVRLEKPRPKPAAEREKDEREFQVLLRLQRKLEGGKSCRELKLDADEEKLVSSFQFIGLKPRLLVMNGEGAKGLPAGSGRT